MTMNIEPLRLELYKKAKVTGRHDIKILCWIIENIKQAKSHKEHGNITDDQYELFFNIEQLIRNSTQDNEGKVKQESLEMINVEKAFQKVAKRSSYEIELVDISTSEYHEHLIYNFHFFSKKHFKKYEWTMSKAVIDLIGYDKFEFELAAFVDSIHSSAYEIIKNYEL